MQDHSEWPDQFDLEESASAYRQCKHTVGLHQLSVFRSNFQSWNSGHVVLKAFESFLECDAYVKLVGIARSATPVNRLAGDPLAFALWNAAESHRPGDEDDLFSFRGCPF